MFILLSMSTAFCWYLILAFKGFIALARAVTVTQTQWALKPRPTWARLNYSKRTRFNRVQYMFTCIGNNHVHSWWSNWLGKLTFQNDASCLALLSTYFIRLGLLLLTLSNVTLGTATNSEAIQVPMQIKAVWSESAYAFLKWCKVWLRKYAGVGMLQVHAALIDTITAL